MKSSKLNRLEFQINNTMVQTNTSFLKKNKKLLTVLTIAILPILLGISTLAVTTYNQRKKTKDERESNQPPLKPKDESKLTYFSSCGELKDKIKEMRTSYSPVDYGGPFIEDKVLNKIGNEASVYYTDTNVQVTGIDEADVVKTNGKQLFTLDKNAKKINIIDVSPINESQKLSEINLQPYFSNRAPSELYLINNKIIVWGEVQTSVILKEYREIHSNNEEKSIVPYNYNTLRIQIYNIEKPQYPVLERAIDLEGSYVSSRVKDNHFYLVTKKIPVIDVPNPFPVYKDNLNKESLDFQPTNKCTEVGILPEEETSPNFNTVLSLSLGDQTTPKFNTFLGSANTIYMNHDHIYLVGQKSAYRTQWDGVPLFSRSRRVPISNQGTYITKLGYKNEEVNFLSSTNFDGTLLNQFSLDEHNGNLRVAGTIGNNTSNFLKIFDKDLNEISNISNLARGEKVYSARFYGDIGVMVTFKQIDPLFVFDLSDAKNPKLKGELKIPGYSDYLQFIDKDTVIGFGKDATESQTSSFGLAQGLKLAVFDIKDMNNPKEISKLILGERGSDSEALKNHKAFVYDKKHNLIMFPARLYEVNPQICKNEDDKKRGRCDLQIIDQGAQVIRLENNTLTKLGEIKHDIVGYGPNKDLKAETAVNRVLVIENGIVTISNNMIKVNDVTDQKQIVELRI